LLLAGGGRLYLEFLVRRGEDDFARRNHLRALPVHLVQEEIEARGGRVDKLVKLDGPSGRRTCRMVVTWDR
jgi:hypothetical protein